MTSTRLPGKVLADIGGRSALALMLSRVQRARRLDAIVVATTINTTDDPIVAECDRLGVATHRGDEHDVLRRFQEAARAYDAGTIVRLTADCPMVDPAVVDEAIEEYRHGSWDYVSNALPRTYPDGVDVEVFSRAAIEEAARNAVEPATREHVTLYINGRRPELSRGDFRIGAILFDADFGHVRWTIDWPEDLERVRRLVAKLPENFTWLQALSVATREPDLLGLRPTGERRS